MTPPAPPLAPSQLRSVLLELRDYADLLQTYEAYSQHGSLPPLNIRKRFKHCEESLPAGLTGYIYHLFENPLCTDAKPITTLTRKGCCQNCKTAVHPEWLHVVSEYLIIYMCGLCRAVFVPKQQTQEISHETP